MSTPIETKIDFVDENTETVESAENVQQDGTTAPVAPETTPEQPEHQHDHTHHHHTDENGELSPLCVGGGCVDAPATK
ncbi:hypothetical protein ADK67_12310 [Saccharothrix sp. NRRL B-16348]|uniref:hypothetical protein n=1 Tax=Saccharothrix sp. NRRL B-16348 TaxID=1415542 RepID=UPI0006AF0DF6|nr:hypothetical protein [Saccharothrix sp. NRRL B-16348]KOX28201.1 hypothetical protein ADK67_12310 [Saccharothrix sp. NRRL B-16348]